MGYFSGFLLLIIPVVCYTQITTRSIRDKSTHTTIPYATIKILNSPKGEIADQDGKFLLDILATDSVLITSVGYTSLLITGREMSSQVFLDRNPALMQNIVVRESVPIRKLLLGNGKDLVDKNFRCRYTEKGAKDNCWPWGPSDRKEEFAEKIILPDSNKIYKLQKIYIPTRKRDKYGPLLLRIYESNEFTGLPGEEIFIKKIDVSSKNISKNKVVVDFSTDNFYLRNNSAIYISIGWLPGTSFANDFTTIALVESKHDNTYARSLFGAYIWYSLGRMRSNEGVESKINTMYAVEVEERRDK